MLTLVQYMRPPQSMDLGLLSRELALDVAEGVYQPEVQAHHVAGKVNVLADALSRDFANSSFVVPAVLRNVAATPVEERRVEWYRTLTTPSKTAKWD